MSKVTGMLSSILKAGTKAFNVGVCGIEFETETGKHKRVIQSKAFSNYAFNTVRYMNKTYQVDEASYIGTNKSKFYKVFNGLPLQSHYQIEIEHGIEEGELTKYVTFHSKIHMNKAVKCSFSFDGSFSDGEILFDRDLVTWVINRYGDVS